jgi:hypothetical protein
MTRTARTCTLAAALALAALVGGTTFDMTLDAQTATQAPR